MKSYTKLKAKYLKDKKVKKAYDELWPEFAVIELIIQKRIEKGLTQKELAERVGTRQSAISRFESGTYNPSLLFLQKVTNALDARMKVSIS
ncbi:MAG TPA: XRE family transcriptional regulator [Candidatus Wildermuthbacteria bacterium]|nr:XRE family transcriptional regulator [Candidatus Wildermuthbacteria bacterium]